MSKVKKCPDLPDSLCNGKVIVNYRPQPNMNLPGTKISFECNKGFQLLSKTSQYICQKNGNWTGKINEAVCKEGKRKLVFFVSC